MQIRSAKPLWRGFGRLIWICSFGFLWLLCCQGAAVFLERSILQPPAAIEPSRISAIFKQARVQAIVVLGGGISPQAAEYGHAQLSESAAQRLHYGAFLARETRLPLAVSGGIGRATASVQDTEAAASARWLLQLGLAEPRWQDAQSKDTHGNAQAMALLLSRDHINHIALVTHANHMPRAKLEFEAAGFQILAAPTHFLGAEQGQGLDWFPSAHGLRNTRRVLHEILGLLWAQYF